MRAIEAAASAERAKRPKSPAQQEKAKVDAAVEQGLRALSRAAGLSARMGCVEAGEVRLLRSVADARSRREDDDLRRLGAPRDHPSPSSIHHPRTLIAAASKGGSRASSSSRYAPRSTQRPRSNRSTLSVLAGRSISHRNGTPAAA